MNSESYIKNYFGVKNPDVVTEISKYLEKKTLQKGIFLADPNTIVKELCFLIKGTVMFYAYMEDGSRNVSCVESKVGGILAPDLEWSSGKPSKQYAEVMCDTEVYAIKVEDFHALQEKFPKEMNEIALRYLTKSYDWLVKHKMILAMPSKKRVMWYEENYADAQIKTEDVANFLNMTREHYSKTRALLQKSE